VTTYIIRRLFLGIVVLFVVSILVFIMMRWLPGDPLRTVLGEDYANYSQEELEVFRHDLGLDEPLIAQYFDWIGSVVKGDFGESIFYQTPVSEMIRERLPVTLNLGFVALIVSSVFGLTFGVIAAIRRGKWPDTVVSVTANLGITLPNFWIAIVLLYIFALKLGWVSISLGYVSPFDDFGEHVKQAILPVFCMSVFGIAAQTRQTRSSMLEVAHQDYIRTAWSKGLKERVVVVRHMVKNGLIPVVTTMGMQVSFMFGGAVFVERVFGIAGIGGMLAGGVMDRDYPAVQGAVLIMALVVVITNLIVDMAYAWLDPRIRESYR
jgi:peptide/nickel transport system permease protein